MNPGSTPVTKRVAPPSRAAASSLARALSGTPAAGLMSGVGAVPATLIPAARYSRMSRAASTGLVSLIAQ